MKKYQVIEDDGGGLYLFVFDENGKVEYAHSGYEFSNGQLLEDLKAMKDGADPAAEWEGNYEDQPDAECTNWDLYADMEGEQIIGDNNGFYYENMGFNGWSEIMDSPEALAVAIRTSEVWDMDLLRQFCKLAGMEEEYDHADEDNFLAILKKAADTLHVEI